MISGYFRIKLKIKKVLILFLECLFYAVIWEIVYYVINGTSLGLAKMMYNCFVNIREYWFMMVYFCLCFIAPYLNKAIDKIDNRECIKLLITLTSLSIFGGFFFGIGGIGRGFTFLHGVNMYIFGMIIHKNIDKFREGKKKNFLLIYLACTVVLSLGAIVLCAIGRGNMVLTFFAYNNPFVIISSVACFMIFISLPQKDNLMLRICSKMSKYTLAVYLITEYIKARQYVFTPAKYILGNLSNIFLRAAVIIVNAIVIFIICVFIDYLRSLLFTFIGRIAKLNKHYNKLNDRCNKLIGNI